MKGKKKMQKKKFWKFMSFLPIILFILAFFIYSVIKEHYEAILIFLIVAFVFCLLIMWEKYCIEKESKYWLDDRKPYY